ncbi:hypothetical protein BDZ94DRAFT_1296406 [Collybia nuda]|uniref:Uncharacterized protein n=1 Tax=Collybia nuda TaxID=64659 RepID=A0A9P5YB65_9AGAR|nr:hypothetical protein BDZ94DRAFT_1296406 [Collybia nuda]
MFFLKILAYPTLWYGMQQHARAGGLRKVDDSSRNIFLSVTATIKANSLDKPSGGSTLVLLNGKSWEFFRVNSTHRGVNVVATFCLLPERYRKPSSGKIIGICQRQISLILAKVRHNSARTFDVCFVSHRFDKAREASSRFRKALAIRKSPSGEFRANLASIRPGLNRRFLKVLHRKKPRLFRGQRQWCAGWDEVLNVGPMDTLGDDTTPPMTRLPAALQKITAFFTGHQCIYHEA